jgi:hypothetical protein
MTYNKIYKKLSFEKTKLLCLQIGSAKQRGAQIWYIILDSQASVQWCAINGVLSRKPNAPHIK